MILFVFEGDEREPRLYRTLERLYFPKVNDNIICSFGNNMNVSKANLLIAGVNAMPKEKSVVNQLSIFERQLLLHVKPNRSVAVLNSFPIFIYEYMK